MEFTEHIGNITESDSIPGLTSQNFSKIAPNGFGDPQNCYPHGMAWFKDHLFVGTTRANLANRAKQVASNTPDKLGEIWPVRIPESYFDNDLRAEIWRYHPPGQEWKRVFVSPIVKGVDGFDVPVSVGFRCMTPFKGSNDSEPALYAPTWGSHQTPGTLMLRSADGDRFEVVSEPGLGIKDNAPRSLRGIVPFNGYLFTSPVVGQKRLEPNIAGTAIVYCSREPNGGSWELACEPHFGNLNNVSVFHMAVFNNHLYAGTLNVYEGFELWKTDAKGTPPFTWKRVLHAGAYRGKLNQMAMTLIAFKNFLYVGSAVQNCSWDFDNKVGPVPPEVIRVGPDDSWDLIFGEPRITPDGLKVPLSGIGPGFGNPFSGYIWAMCVHQGWLYISTAVWAVFLRYAGRSDRWPKHMRSVLSPDNLEKILLHNGGCDLWRTRNGRHWQPVTVNGFGNVFNIGFRNMVSSPYGLFVGAANPFSPEVAVRRLNGWNYEKNERGGLEIWFGAAPEKERPGQEKTYPSGEIRRMRDRLLKEDNSTGSGHLVDELVDEFFGNSRYRHFGLWKVGIRNPKDACDNLMAELTALVAGSNGDVLDMCCGYGATTRYLTQYFATGKVVGVTADRAASRIRQENAKELNVIVNSLPKLRFSAEVFDTAVWARSLVEQYDSKEILHELYRVLKHGGQVVGMDWIVEKSLQSFRADSGQDNGKPQRNMVAYEQLLKSIGYENIRVFEVTERSRGDFKRYLAKYLTLRSESGIVDEITANQAEKYLLKQAGKKCSCCIFSASKTQVRSAEKEQG